MSKSVTRTRATLRSPLHEVLRRSGATMIERHGRCVPLNFGSAAGEAAACLRSAGITDRWDRSTLELLGTPAGVELALSALASLGERAWVTLVDPQRAIVRCELGSTEECILALGRSGDAVVYDVSDDYAAIGIIGPRAHELLDEAAVDPSEGPAIVLVEADHCYEVVVEAGAGPELWNALLDAGEPMHAACVGFDALDHLAASHRLGSGHLL